MTGIGILNEIRRRLHGVDEILDSTGQIHSDEFWFEYIDSAVNYLTATDIVTVQYLVAGTSISPEPSTIDGLLIATWSVWQYLSGDLNKKLKDGSLGIRFKSGLDEFSTVEAARKIETVITQSEKAFRHLVVMKLADKESKAVRVQ